MEDREILQRLRSGDESGMEALLGQYGPLLRYVVKPILPREEDREDCLSEISLRIWERVGSFTEDRGTLAAWLTAIARNMALNHARREGLRASEELSHQAADPGPSPEEAVLRRERQETLRRALEALDQRDRLPLLPEILLLPIHRADRPGAGSHGAGGGGAALSDQGTAAAADGR